VPRSSEKFDPTELEVQATLWFLKEVQSWKRLSSELHVSANPTIDWSSKDALERYANIECFLQWRTPKPTFQMIMRLVLMSWWMSDDLRSAIQFLVWEEKSKWGLDRMELEIVLLSKTHCILFYQNKIKSWSEFFGNYLNIKKNSIVTKEGQVQTFSILDYFPVFTWVDKSKPIEPQRIRGYRDKGSLGNPFTRQELQDWHNSYQYQQLVDEINLRIKTYKDTLGLALGFLE